MATVQKNGSSSKNQDKLKKIEAKLLRSQETFEVLNTTLIEEFINAQHQRAAFMQVTAVEDELPQRFVAVCSCFVVTCVV